MPPLVLGVVLLADGAAMLSLISKPIDAPQSEQAAAAERVYGRNATRIPLGDDELSRELAINEVAVIEHLGGREIAFLGTVRGVHYDKRGGFIVEFFVNHTPLRCEMRRGEKSRAIRLARDRSAIVRGRFVRRDGSLFLERCRMSYAFDEDPALTAKSAELCAARLRSALGEDTSAAVAFIRRTLGRNKPLKCNEPIILAVTDCEEWKAGRNALLQTSCERMGVVNILNEIGVGDDGLTRREAGGAFAVAPQGSALYRAAHSDEPRQ